MRLDAGAEPVGDEEEEGVKFLNNSHDAENGLDWQFEDGKARSPNANYVFCPAPHRKPIYRFTKHFCQHPLLSERDGT
jgi:hypothetical protein